MTPPPARLVLPLALGAAFVLPASAQQLIGYVNTRDADVSGASDVLDGQAVLSGAVSITAKDHTAPILLARGGSVRVCQTSALHLTERREMSAAAPLLFSLDRGAIEIQMGGTSNDSIMTPDLRFTVRSAGRLDLRLRVARNGDTCVENRGSGAPTLAVSDPFGESMYEVAPGQHVLFEHGSLHEVVDHESSPCGCPDEKGMSMADALLASGGGKTIAPVPPKPPAAAVQAPPPVVVTAPAPIPAPAIAPASAPAVAPAPVAKPPVAVASAVVSAPIPAPAATPAPTRTPAVVPASAPAPPPTVAAPAPVPAAAPPTEQEVQAAEEAAARAAIQAANQHPFPAAVSEGLAPAAEAPPPPPSQAHTQVTDQLSYNAPAMAVPAPAAKAPAAPAALAKAQKKARAPKVAKPQPAAPQPAVPKAKPATTATMPSTSPQPPANDVAHVVGRFFKHIFTWH